jgi:hypothetical protein
MDGKTKTSAMRQHAIVVIIPWESIICITKSIWVESTMTTLTRV